MSKESNERAAKRKRGEQPTAVGADDAVDAIGKLIEAAAEQIAGASNRLERQRKHQDREHDRDHSGGRGLALVGIGNALVGIGLGIARLIRVAEAGAPILEPEGAGLKAVSPYCCTPGCSAVRAPAYLNCAEHAGLDTAGDPPGDSAEARIARWRNAEAGQEDEGAVELIVAAEEELAAYRERFGPLRAAVEIEVAVVCVDCQAEFNHGPGRCGRGIRCAVCVTDVTDKCSSCGGEIVLGGPVPPMTEKRCAACEQMVAVLWSGRFVAHSVGDRECRGGGQWAP